VVAFAVVEGENRTGTPFSPPFGLPAVAWWVIEVADAGDEVRVAPYLDEGAVRERLDATLGVTGWSVRYQLAPGDAVACQLEIGGVSKGAVRGLPRVGGAQVAAALALSAAAELFGARLPVPADLSAWVACDPASHAPLHPPNVASEPRPPGDAPAIGPADVAGAAGPGRPVAGEGTVAEPVKPDGQAMIDRLIDRLKEQGHGLAAARILVKHGGYGKDPQAARELYAALRSLLISGHRAEGVQSE